MDWLQCGALVVSTSVRALTQSLFLCGAIICDLGQSFDQLSHPLSIDACGANSAITAKP